MRRVRVAGRGRAWLRAGLAATAVIAVALGGVWLARVPIADHFIAQALRERGVPARYTIVRIGPRTQRLENVVFGPPARPDLVARQVDVKLGYGLSGVRVMAIRARGVRANARHHDGVLSFGSLDRLLGEGGAGGDLPDIVVDLDDSRMALATDQGPVALALAGVGNLRSGFSGRLVVASPGLALGACRLDRPGGPLTLATDAGRFLLKGPLAARSLDCGSAALAIDAPRIDLDLRADPAFADLSAALAVSARAARQGGRRLDGLSGLVTARGSAQELAGNAALAARSARTEVVASGDVRFGGRFALRPGAGSRAFSFAPMLTLADVRPTDPRLFAQAAGRLAGTPLAPIAERLAEVAGRAARGNLVTVSGRIDGDGEQNRLLVNGARFASASGARLALVSGSELRIDLARGTIDLRGTVEMAGGGLPEGRADFVSRGGGALDGTVSIAEYRVGTARLALAPLRFSRSRDGGLAIRTQVALDGPLPDGRLEGFVLPLDARITPAGALRFAQDCLPLRWEALRLANLQLDPARFALCGVNGESVGLAGLSLRGRIGESPLRLSADRVGFDRRSARFTLAGLDVRIGAGAQPVHLAAVSLDGAVLPGGVLAGGFGGGTAVIGPVPLDLSDLAGRWRFANARLGVEGRLRVADAAGQRFMPLVAQDVQLTLADGVIAASGTLSPPARKAKIAHVVLRHDLSSGVGRADFSVDRLVFGPDLLVSDVTPLATGIVANVEGAVAGKGEIRWSSDGVTGSTGTFATPGMDFAGAFGPVRGLATSLTFVDLLGMKTAPHQRLTVREVNPGVAVFDGVVDFQLLSNLQARIEGGHWPFAGGDLDLLPTTLDLDSRRPRQLTFRVRSLDAGAFINTLELQNISATGTYDGVLPMVFDATGGRIDGGVLVARQVGLPPLVLSAGDALPACDRLRQAGSLAYVGAVSNAETGRMGQLAFDVLKHLNYRCLVIRLDGALDDEFVTRVAIDGVNQGTEAARKSFLTRPFVGLPFLFNIRIEAPFRGLMNSMAAYADPSALVRGEVDRQLREGGNSPLAVQPPDSDKRIEGKTQ